MAIFKPVQVQKLYLAGSGCSSTATSIILRSFKLPDSSTNVTTSDLGDFGFFTLEPGTTREEQIKATTITQNGDGTATLSGVTRGLRFVDPYDEVSANKFSHAGGAVVVLSNTAGFYDQFFTLDDTQTLTNKRIEKRVTVAADATSITPAGDSSDMVTQLNTQAVGTLTINAPTGTPVNAQILILRIRSTNIQTYSWNAIYAATPGVALPTTTTGSSNYNYIAFSYNTTNSKWDCVGSI